MLGAVETLAKGQNHQMTLHRSMMCGLAAMCLWFPPKAAPAEEVAVELELVLLADASSSIRGNEFDLQTRGYANAFRDPRVIAAIEGLGGNGIAVTYVQWSATFQQTDTVPWMHIRNGADALRFADAVTTQSRRFQGFGTATGIALQHGAAAILENRFQGRRKIIDITSDEHSNQGRHPASVRGEILAAGITVNGLIILDDEFDLEAYFRASVIGGEDAFVIAVESYADFADAILRKILREITGAPAAALPRSRTETSLAAR